MVVDDLLAKFSQQGFKIKGYAVDLIVVFQVKFEATISERLQATLNWFVKVELKVNPEKTSAVAFTKDEAI